MSFFVALKRQIAFYIYGIYGIQVESDIYWNIEFQRKRLFHLCFYFCSEQTNDLVPNLWVRKLLYSLKEKASNNFSSILVIYVWNLSLIVIDNIVVLHEWNIKKRRKFIQYAIANMLKIRTINKTHCKAESKFQAISDWAINKYLLVKYWSSFMWPLIVLAWRKICMNIFCEWNILPCECVCVQCAQMHSMR